MSSRETVVATLALDDLVGSSPSSSGSGPSDGTDRPRIERAAQNMFGLLGKIQHVALDGDTVAVTLVMERRSAMAKTLLDRGMRLIGLGKLGAAIESLQQALRHDPADARTHYNLGVAYLIKNDIEKAALSFVRSLALMGSPSADVLLGLGNVARRRGESARARRYYERAHAADPASADAARNLGVALAETGEMDAAAAAFRAALTRAPRVAETHAGLAMALASLGQRDEAVRQYREVLEITGGRGPAAEAARAGLRDMGIDVAAPVSMPEARTMRGQPTLLAATRAILDEVAATTGRGFTFVADPTLSVLATIQIARGDMPAHRILYKPGAPGVALDHLIAHECGHLVRLWTVDPAARRLAVSDRVLQVGAIEQLGQELADMANAGMPPPALSRMFGLMYPGAVRQVTNVAIDIRIERWLHGQHTALREAQRASLTAQTRENAQVLDPQIARITPPTIYHASTAMGSAFARAVANLYDEPALAAPYRATDVWDLGGELLDTIAHARDDADGDVALVDRWAKRLGLRDWYRWEQLDTLPPTEAIVSS